MAVVVVALARNRNLFGVVVLGGIYSFLTATVLVALDAVDVAMTEASVGAGISTVLFLGALLLCKSEEAKPLRSTWVPLALSATVGGVLVYGTLGLPGFADEKSPMHAHVAPRYLKDGPKETGVPNVVTAVLASYRGYDTFGETTVVFTAGAGVVTLLRRRRRKSGTVPKAGNATALQPDSRLDSGPDSRLTPAPTAPGAATPERRA